MHGACLPKCYALCMRSSVPISYSWCMRTHKFLRMRNYTVGFLNDDGASSPKSTLFLRKLNDVAHARADVHVYVTMSLRHIYYNLIVTLARHLFVSDRSMHVVTSRHASHTRWAMASLLGTITRSGDESWHRLGIWILF